jgi:ABC-type multidrug transport system fused ATPase/permease subunit
LLNESLLKSDIIFKNVTFSYPTRPDQVILKDLNLVIPGGKILAVVGPSGSGKSTLASLILRYYDPQQGSIFLGNKDIRTLPQENLRSHIGTVPQEPVLFSMSIKDNIAYGANHPENVSLEEIYEVTDQANAFSFIDQFPDKFNTIVGERGANLSGGKFIKFSFRKTFF